MRLGAKWMRSWPVTARVARSPGVGRALKQRYPKAKVIAMEPAEAALLCGEMPCCHSIEGVTGGFVPPLLRSAPLDDEIKVRSADALAMTRRLHRDFGLLVGTSFRRQCPRGDGRRQQVRSWSPPS